MRCLTIETVHTRTPAGLDRSDRFHRASRENPHAAPADDPFVHLRRVVPIRELTLAQAFAIAEHQAAILLDRLGVIVPPVPTSALTSLPRIVVGQIRSLPVSAFAQRDGTRWLIAVNSSEPATRQRFSLAHELKHIIDSPFDRTIYRWLSRAERERVSDCFAACLLMPASWIVERRELAADDIRGVARQLGVSPLALRVRLVTLGLNGTRRASPGWEVGGSMSP